MITFACINEATTLADADMQKMLPAQQLQWNTDLTSQWRVDTAHLLTMPKDGQAPVLLLVAGVPRRTSTRPAPRT